MGWMVCIKGQKQEGEKFEDVAREAQGSLRFCGQSLDFLKFEIE